MDFKHYSPLLRILKGFTLVELIVVIGIIGILAGFILFTLNPFTQLEKGRDAKRESDIRQLQVASDTFYNDTNCYPVQITDSYLNENYIQKIPSDPSGASYLYIPDPSTCPQWSIFMAKLSYEPTNKVSCPLETLQNCVPSNYDVSGYNYCVISGDVKCSDVHAVIISITPVPPPGGSTSTNTPTPTSNPSTPTISPTSTPTPTPPAPHICSGNIFAYSSSPDNCNELGSPVDCNFIAGGENYVCYQNRSNLPPFSCEVPICTDYR